MPSGIQVNYFTRSPVLWMMSGQQGMIRSFGRVLTQLSRPLWQTSHHPQSVKSSFLSSEIFLPLCWLTFNQTPLLHHHLPITIMWIAFFDFDPRYCYLMENSFSFVHCFKPKLVTPWNLWLPYEIESCNNIICTWWKCMKGDLDCKMYAPQKKHQVAKN